MLKSKLFLKSRFFLGEESFLSLWCLWSLCVFWAIVILLWQMTYGVWLAINRLGNLTTCTLYTQLYFPGCHDTTANLKQNLKKRVLWHLGIFFFNCGSLLLSFERSEFCLTWMRPWSTQVPHWFRKREIIRLYVGYSYSTVYRTVKRENKAWQIQECHLVELCLFFSFQLISSTLWQTPLFSFLPRVRWKE